MPPPTRIDCPHCSSVLPYDPESICFHERHADPRTFHPDEMGILGLEYHLCRGCNRYIVHLSDQENNKHLVWPNATVRRPLPDIIPAKYARDYEEAAAVLSISPKASAALTRRCLHHFLQDEAKANESWSLEKQMEHAMALSPPIFHPRLAKRVDHIRVIAKFAAHPKKNTNTEEIIDVEPEEAEYLLQVMWEIFVHHFIEPPTDAARNAAISEKVAEARRAPKV